MKLKDAKFVFFVNKNFFKRFPISEANLRWLLNEAVNDLETKHWDLNKAAMQKKEDLDAFQFDVIDKEGRPSMIELIPLPPNGLFLCVSKDDNTFPIPNQPGTFALQYPDEFLHEPSGKLTIRRACGDQPYKGFGGKN